VFLQRLRLRHRAWLAIAVVVGVGFGVSFASFAAARQTASAYGRILDAADAGDATVSYPVEVVDAEQIISGIGIVERQRRLVGYVGFVDGIDPAVARTFLASADGVFPLERPRMSAGRLPDQREVDEAFVNSYVADRTGIEVGDELSISVFAPDFASTAIQRLTVVGIGTFPREVVVDQTALLGVVVLTQAFAQSHADSVIYGQSTVTLRPGADASTDLARELAPFGFEVQETRTQLEGSVNQAVRPLLVVVVALGVLALVATAVVASQLLQRERERWRTADTTLVALGVVRSQVVRLHLATAAAITPIAVIVAAVAMWIASPVAPVGPLHDFDPAQGQSLDRTVAGLGALLIVVVLFALTLLFTVSRRADVRRRRVGGAGVPLPIRRPAALAGLSLALSGSRLRGRTSRAAAAAAMAIALTAFAGTVVVSAATLSRTPTRYGLDGDVLAVNPYGDQELGVLEMMFGPDDDVVAASAYHAVTFLLDGTIVPGMTVTAVKGEHWPTILRGDPPRHADEIVVGEDTLSELGADLGDEVAVQIVRFDGSPSAAAIALRIVGTATFPPVVQVGFQHARLGLGAIVSRAGYDGLQGNPDDQPEWTVLRLAEGVDAHEFIRRFPEGIPDPTQTPTIWFTDAKPAELRQLDSLMSTLATAVAVAYLVALGVITHGLWSQARWSRRELAILHAVGLTRRQLSEVVGWQAVPLVLTAVVVGTPLGIFLGRVAFSAFARSFDVVDNAATPATGLAVFIAAVFLAALVGIVVASRVGGHIKTAVLLRQQ